jgi:hypothetical protein
MCDFDLENLTPYAAYRFEAAMLHAFFTLTSHGGLHPLLEASQGQIARYRIGRNSARRYWLGSTAGFPLAKLAQGMQISFGSDWQSWGWHLFERFF